MNNRGRMLCVCCVINMIVAVYLANCGSYMSVFSTCVAAYCGMSTYSARSQHLTAEQINNTNDNGTDESG